MNIIKQYTKLLKSCKNSEGMQVLVIVLNLTVFVAAMLIVPTPTVLGLVLLLMVIVNIWALVDSDEDV